MAGNPGIAQHTAPNSALSHQERVNVEMFKAIEMLGRKLERAEGERERLIRRLMQIESAATVDEKTGKLYLPVAAGQALPPKIIERRAPGWQGAASVMSSVIALCALGLVLFREPQPQQQQLTPRQLAALDALAQSHFASLDTGAWKPVGADTPSDDFAEIDVRRFTRADDAPFASEASEEPAAATRLAESERVPTAGELAAIEPAGGAAAAEETGAAPEVFAPEEAPAAAPAPQMAAQPPEKAPEEKVAAAEKPLPEPASASAPIPLTQPAAQEEPPKKAEPVIQKQAEQKPAAKPSLDGVEPDSALPGKLAALEQRAFEGVPEAQHDLATIYAAGKIVAQDFRRAVFWFSKASEKGVANADYNLGVMFQQGLGVRKDVNKALGWYEKAAQRGHPEAMYNLGIAYIEGIGAARNISRGVSFFKQAANAGVAQAAYNLGVLYESNFIGPIDIARATEWYQAAASEGHQEARDAILRLKGEIGRAYEGEDDTAAINDRGLALASAIEPAAGGEEEGGYGEGDETPLDEQGRALAPSFGNDMVRQIQEALIRRGELPAGTASGYMTPQTEDAIRAWQKKLGWDASGKPTYELLEKISAAKE